MAHRIRLFLSILVALSCLRLGAAPPPASNQFHVAVYIPVGVVEQMKDPGLARELLEGNLQPGQGGQGLHRDLPQRTRRRRCPARDRSRNSLLAHGVQVAGGIALRGRRRHGRRSETGGGGQFVSFCYTDPRAARLCQAHLPSSPRATSTRSFSTTSSSTTPRRDSDIAAKGDASWTDFRLTLMDDVSRDLVVGAARAVNPKVKVVIKFPNWYEHFQANGYDLDRSRRSSTASTPARRPAIRSSTISTCSSTRATRSSATSTTSSPAQRRRLGRHLRHPLSRPLRRAAMGHHAGQGAGDHALPVQRPARPAAARRSRGLERPADQLQHGGPGEVARGLGRAAPAQLRHRGRLSPWHR